MAKCLQAFRESHCGSPNGSHLDGMMNVRRLSLIALLTGVLGLAWGTTHQLGVCTNWIAAPLGSLRKAPAWPWSWGPDASVADYLHRETLLTSGGWQPERRHRRVDKGSLLPDINQLLVRQLAWRLDCQRVVR